MDVYSSLIHKSQKVETAQIPISRLMVKHVSLHTW